MHFYRLPLFLATALLLHAQPNEPKTPADMLDDKTLTLEPMVIAERLDRAREDIVPNLGASSYQMDFSQIAIQARGADAPFSEVLLHVPGVAQDSGNQVHLRGEHANLQYRINDVLLPEGIGGFGQELDTRFVDTMQVLTGALPAQYGYRTSGVVDIHTKHGGDPVDTFSLYSGSHSTFRPSIEAGGNRGSFDYYLSGSSDSNARGIENPTDSREAIHDHTTQFKGFGYFSLLLAPESRLNLIVSGSDAHFEIPNNPDQSPRFMLRDVSSFDSSRLDERQDEDTRYAVLSFQRTQGETSFQAVAFARSSGLHFTPDIAGDLIFNGVASDVRRNVLSQGFEFDERWVAGDRHTLRGGLLAAFDRSTTHDITSVFRTNDSGVPSSDVPFTITQGHPQRGTVAGAYVQDEWKISDQLTLNAGVRAVEFRALIREGQLSPRLNLVWKHGDKTTVHAGYARYFTPPPIELLQSPDLAAFANTTNAPTVTTRSSVRSERSHYFDLGLEQKVSRAFSVDLDSYYKSARDQLDEGQFGQAIVFAPFNYDRAQVYGLEASGNVSRGSFNAYVNLAASRATAQRIVSGEFQFDPDELGYIATHAVHLDHDQTYTASAGASYTWRHTLFHGDLVYGSGLRRGFANTEKMPGYAPVNFGVERSFVLRARRKLKLRLDLVNVFDEVYELRDGSGIGVGAPQFGERRAIFAGVSFTL